MLARAELLHLPGMGRRLPQSLGVALGHLADAVSAVAGRPLPFSAARLRKFCTETRFVRSAALPGFVAPVPLAEGLRQGGQDAAGAVLYASEQAMVQAHLDETKQQVVLLDKVFLR